MIKWIAAVALPGDWTMDQLTWEEGLGWRVRHDELRRSHSSLMSNGGKAVGRLGAIATRRTEDWSPVYDERTARFSPSG